MLHILRKIQVIPRKSPSHIIIHLLSALSQLLKLRNDLLIAALSSPVGTHPVVDFFSPVDAENYIAHFFIDKFHNFFVQKNAVGRQRKAEFFMKSLLQAPSVCHQILYHLPVHQRLPAEKIHFQVDPVPRIRHKEIQRLSPRFIAHQSPSSMIFSFFCKTISASQVTVMGHMQTKRLDYRFPFFKITDIAFINIRRIKLPRFL